MDEFRGKVAAVTGGASGIGFAMAQRLAREGMRLVLGDVQASALDAAIAQLRSAGVEALGVQTDVTDFAQVQALEATAVDAYGKVHLLCKNAGVSITGPSWRLTLDDWRGVWDVNVSGLSTA